MDIVSKLDELYKIENCQLGFITEFYYRDLERIDKLLQEGTLSSTVEKIKNSYHKNIHLVEKALLDHGINVKRIKDRSKKLGSQVKGDFEKKIPPKELQNKLISGTLKIMKEEVSGIKMTFGEKVISSILVFMVVLILNTTLASIASVIFAAFGAPQLATILLALVIAPVIEEGAKKFALEQDYPWVYTGIFAGLEMLKFVISTVADGGILGPVIIMRTITLMMHFATVFIQKHFKEEDPTSKNKYSSTGYFLAVAMHSLFNLLGIIFNTQIARLVEL